ncbi:cornifelin homolog [Glandiceps talaboti]
MSYNEFDAPMYQQQQPQAPVMQQPAPTPMPTHTTNTTVIVQQPIVMREAGPRVWSSDLCSCCNEMSSCLLSACFPLCFEMHLWNRSNENICGPCCIHNSALVLRTKLRTQYSIQGSIMSDCCTTLCCYQCALCQMSREMDFAERTGQDGGLPRSATVQ